MVDSTVGRPMEILLVEDNLLDARVTIEALRKGQIQHRMTYIPDGAEAMEFLHREGRFARAPQPDLILLDLHLPKKDGLEVLAELKRDPRLSRGPVVVLTASEVAADRQRCEEFAVDSYITKPVNLEKFLDVVRQLKRYWLAADVILPGVE